MPAVMNFLDHSSSGLTAKAVLTLLGAGALATSENWRSLTPRINRSRRSAPSRSEPTDGANCAAMSASNLSGMPLKAALAADDRDVHVPTERLLLRPDTLL